MKHTKRSLFAFLTLLVCLFAMVSCAMSDGYKDGSFSIFDGYGAEMAPGISSGGDYGEGYAMADSSVGGKSSAGAPSSGDTRLSDAETAPGAVDAGAPSKPGDPAEPTDPGDPAEPTDPGDPAEPADPDEPTEPTDPDDPAEPDDEEIPEEEPEKLNEDEIRELVRAGLLTAGAWDDNRYYSMWQELFVKGQSYEKNGKFLSYAEDDWNMNTRNRVKVTVTGENGPEKGAAVYAKDAEGNVVAKAVTDVKGIAYLFPTIESGTVFVSSAGMDSEEMAFTAEERELSFSVGYAVAQSNLIELMFVVDVTGSMGDEIDYLKAELGDVIARVAANDSETHIRLSFLFYRDNGDEDETFKFYYVDFRDVTDPDDYAVQQAELAKQYADGGGDWPEALDEALQIAVSKQWSKNSTKLIFVVLDAPAHEKQKNKDTYSAAVYSAAEQGIRICPVLASGADELTEYITRSAAIVTGGTFVFITNDSGIGGDHLDPELPNVVIERLNLLLARLIKGYHTGDFGQPVWWNVKQ